MGTTRTLVAVGCVLACAATAVATEYYASSEKLVGWSEDGEHYAVIVSGAPDEPEELVVRKGETQVKAIGAEETRLEDGDRLTALERINVEKHRELAPFKLRRVAGAWRTQFKKQYTVDKLRPEKGKRGDCKAVGWTLARNSDKAVVHTFRSKGCVTRVAGGYLHPNGKRALVKFTESHWESGARSTEVEDTRYLLVPLE